MARKTINVAAAIIERDGKVLATERGYGEFEGGWEFPGGKIEPGETGEQAIVREIMEELEVDVVPHELLCTVEYDYPEFHLSMECFICTMADEKLVLTEHHAARWLDAANLDSVAWLPADEEVIAKLKQRKELQR